MGDLPLDHAVTALVNRVKAVKDNELSQIEEILTAQAMTLNIMFGEIARRSALNMGEHMEASQRFMKMALEAQYQSRMSLETLSAIKTPPVIYARQANIAHGPQQVNGAANLQHAEENGQGLNKLMEAENENAMDNGAALGAGKCHSELKTLGEGKGAPVPRIAVGVMGLS